MFGLFKKKKPEIKIEIILTEEQKAQNAARKQKEADELKQLREIELNAARLRWPRGSFLKLSGVGLSRVIGYQWSNRRQIYYPACDSIMSYQSKNHHSLRDNIEELNDWAYRSKSEYEIINMINGYKNKAEEILKYLQHCENEKKVSENETSTNIPKEG